MRILNGFWMHIENSIKVLERKNKSFKTVVSTQKENERFYLSFFFLLSTFAPASVSPLMCSHRGKLGCDKYIWFLILCPTVVAGVMGFLLG